MNIAGVFLAALALALTGCAALQESECRGDSYELGVRDARRAMAPDAEGRAAACKALGIELDSARYRQGWESAYHFHPVGA
jgi:hypothetical protein